jgi:hypothetical protein
MAACMSVRGCLVDCVRWRRTLLSSERMGNIGTAF